MLRYLKYTVLCTAVAVVSCSKKTEQKEESTTYPVSNPIKRDTAITKEYVAKIQSAKNIEIRAQEKGILEKIFVDEGQYVKQGQVLFQIMPQFYRAEYAKAQAEVAQAKIELQNASTLANNNIVSKNEKAMAQAKLQGANAEMRLAQLHLSFTNVRAPFSGVINRLPLRLGSLVDEGSLLTTLSDNSGLYAYFNVSEPEYINYQTHADQRENQQVTLVMANGQEMPDRGYIQNVGGEFDSESGNISFRAKFPNPNQLLRNGETGKIRMKVPVTGAIIIPQKSTYEIQDKTYVFVVDHNGVAKSREIKIAYELPDVYVVAGGITEKDRILLEGTDKVKDDDKLKIKYVNPAQVMRELKYNAN